MISADHQKNQFAGRLKRIEKGGPNTMGQIYIGPAEDMRDPSGLKPHFGIVATVLAFVLGVVAYAAGHLGQFHLVVKDGAPLAARLGESGLNAAATIGDVLLAAVILFVLIKLVFRMRGLGPAFVGAIGLFVMMGAESKIMQAAPEIYAALYSQEFVARQTGAGPPTYFY